MTQTSINSIRIGDVALESNSKDMDDLVNILLWLLQNEDIKTYLGLVKSKNAGGYLG